MPTLNQQQMNALQSAVNASDISGFYALLESYGDSYGRLGGAVTDNGSWQGELANAFAAHAAGDDSVDLSYGSTTWTALNKDIAQAYLTTTADNGGATPTWDAIQGIHNAQYQAKGLDPDDWLPNRLLNESADPGNLWADYLTNDGAGDLIGDGLGILATSGKLLFGPRLMYEEWANGTLDPAEVAFARNFIHAVANMSDNSLAEMAVDFTVPSALRDLADFLGELPQGARNLLGDYGWALDNPGALWDGLKPSFPSWIPGVTQPFGQAENTGSPLVLDLAGTGINLAALSGQGSVYWNFDGGDFANASGWIAEGSGLLAIDLNDDGIINDNSELFGTLTTDGFTVLSAYGMRSTRMMPLGAIFWCGSMRTATATARPANSTRWATFSSHRSI